MATNLYGSGERVNYTAPTGGLVSGTIIAYGTQMCGVVAESVTGGALVALDLVGEWTTTQKDAGASLDWTIGEPVYLTSTGGLTTVEAGSTPAGVASAVAATGATTGRIILNAGKGT